MTVPVLGHPSLEESYPLLANQSSAQGQAGWSKGSKGGTPSEKISFVSLVAYGPKIFYSILAMGGYSFWNQAGRFPTKGFVMMNSFNLTLSEKHFISPSILNESFAE